MKKYTAIILSAGYSSRMGSFKPLMDLAGETPLQRCIDLFTNSGINDIIVVTGYLDASIRENVKNNIRIVHNNRFSEGMYTSIKAGVQGLKVENEAFFILPVDIPTVKEHTVKKMIEGYEEIKDGILYPVFDRQMGHPVLISNKFAEEIIKSNPAYGLRDILNKHKEEWNIVETADRGILLDMDTMEDFNILVEHVSKYPCPDYQECMEILRLCKTREDTVLHMKCTAEFARKVATLLNNKGFSLNINYIYAGALLHDVAKGIEDHAKAGADIVESFGYECLKNIISEHMELKENHIIDEKEIVFLCDKLIKGTNFVTLEERFKKSFIRYANAPDILKNVNKKYNDAKLIKEGIEKILGFPLSSLR